MGVKSRDPYIAGAGGGGRGGKCTFSQVSDGDFRPPYYQRWTRTFPLLNGSNHSTPFLGAKYPALLHDSSKNNDISRLSIS